MLSLHNGLVLIWIWTFPLSILGMTGWKCYIQISQLYTAWPDCRDIQAARWYISREVGKHFYNCATALKGKGVLIALHYNGLGIFSKKFTSKLLIALFTNVVQTLVWKLKEIFSTIHVTMYNWEKMHRDALNMTFPLFLYVLWLILGMFHLMETYAAGLCLTQIWRTKLSWQHSSRNIKKTVKYKAPWSISSSSASKLLIKWCHLYNKHIFCIIYYRIQL